jgi:hypothetical protein
MTLKRRAASKTCSCISATGFGASPIRVNLSIKNGELKTVLHPPMGEGDRSAVVGVPLSAKALPQSLRDSPLEEGAKGQKPCRGVSHTPPEREYASAKQGRIAYAPTREWPRINHASGDEQKSCNRLSPLCRCGSARILSRATRSHYTRRHVRSRFGCEDGGYYLSP